jgi:hypothetical protein
MVNNPYTNSHFTNKATADGFYRALQNEVCRMERKYKQLKGSRSGVSKAELAKQKNYIELMRYHKVIE